MSATEDNYPSRRRLRRFFSARTLAVFVAAIIGLGAWTVYRAVAVSLQAEENLHATLFTIQFVERFVADQGRWPHSWEELEKLPISKDSPAPMHGEINTLRIGGQHGYVWPAASADIQRRVFIDFEADPQKVVQEEPQSFTAVKPIGPFYEYRDYGFVDSLQATIRKSVKAFAPISEEIAIKKARQHLESRGSAFSRDEASATKKEDGSWAILFEERPAYPGGHLLVLLSPAGEVIKVIPGR